MTRTYDAYLFDWDGTLARTLEAWLEILRTCYNKYGLFPDDAAIVASFGVKDAEIAFGMPKDKVAQFYKDVENAWYNAFAAPPLYDGAVELLQALKAHGAKRALITSSLRSVVHRDLATHDIIALFDSIITGHDVNKRKPDPEALLLALARLDVRPERAVMVGDSDKDLLAAQNAGVDSMLFYPPIHQIFYDFSELKAYKPTHIIRSWQELRDQLQ